MGKENEKHQLGYVQNVLVFTTIFVAVVIGHIRDQFGKVFIPWKYKFYMTGDYGEPPLFTTFDSFFIRRIYRRISDCWNRPIRGTPGRITEIYERKSLDCNETFEMTGNTIKALNFGSYNYLGLANGNTFITEKILEAVDKYDINTAYPTAEYRSNDLTTTLERKIAEFLHQEDAIAFSMGYGTNTTSIPVIMKDSLILSDEMNHASIIKGIKLCKAKVEIYKHNDMRDLESKLRFHITQGIPDTHRPWKKIFVVVEGIYSMEGTIVKLKRLVDLKKIYKFYIFMDEAHSIGAMGHTGRGISEYHNVSYNDVDIYMGTFTKSFAGFGGYIAGKRVLIDLLRRESDFAKYGEQISPIVCIQIIESLEIIKNEPKILEKLRENTRKVRKAVNKLKFYVIGDEDSPVIPLLIPSAGKIGEFSRLCLDREIAVVVVGYPATPILLNRVRLCVSAAHTSKDIDKLITVINQIANIIGMKQ